MTRSIQDLAIVLGLLSLGLQATPAAMAADNDGELLTLDGPHVIDYERATLDGEDLSEPDGVSSDASSTIAGDAATATGRVDTVFLLDRPVTLSDAADAIAETGARPVAFEHSTPGRGGFHSDRLALNAAVSFYRSAFGQWYEGEPQVFAFRLEGAVATARLGNLAAEVVTRHEVDEDDTVVSNAPGEGSADAGQVATNPIAPASVPTSKPWAPERGWNDLYNDTGQCFPGIITCAEARGADLYLTFDRTTPGDEFAADWAYEHDFKLYNSNNWNTDGVCPASQRNDFWADQNAGIAWDTTMPDPYLDTGASDNCRYHDLTIGSYNPDEFDTGTYIIRMIIAPGDHGDSEYQLRAEALDKDCEFSPWCVGIGGAGEGQLLVGVERGVAPGCRTWDKETGSAPC